MENYIVINGKKAELTDEQLKKLGIKPEKNKYEEMFDRKLHDRYYFIDSKSSLDLCTDDHDAYDENYYCTGNYCKDADVMTQRALHEILNRLLWRASVIAGELDNSWDGNNLHYCIYKDHCLSGRWEIACLTDDKYSEVYFPTREFAEHAIEEIIKPFMEEHPDFVW